MSTVKEVNEFENQGDIPDESNVSKSTEQMETHLPNKVTPER